MGSGNSRVKRRTAARKERQRRIREVLTPFFGTNFAERTILARKLSESWQQRANLKAAIRRLVDEGVISKQALSGKVEIEGPKL